MDLSWISGLRHHTGRDLCLSLACIALVVSACYIRSPYGWIGIVASVSVFAATAWVYRGAQHELSSDKWFAAIAASLDDATEGIVYLRSFVHPDDFKEKHRESLLNIMEALARKIAEHPGSFRVIAYHDRHTGDRDPVEWVESEIARTRGHGYAQRVIRDCICVIGRQPASNSSTIYLIDSNVLIFNRKIDDRFVYSKIDLSRSLLPQFIKTGMLHAYEEALAGQEA